MITAKNYAAQAEASMRKTASLGHVHEVDRIAFNWLADSIQEAQHFVLQDGGVVFDDKLKGMRGMEMRLPFPCITIEYFRPYRPTEYYAEAPVYYPKTVVIARQVTSDYLHKIFGFHIEQYRHEKFVNLVTFIGYEEDLNIWVPSLGFMLVPPDWDHYDKATHEIDNLSPGSGTGIMITGSPYPLIPTICEQALQQMGAEKFKQAVAHDNTSEVRVVLELCEALTCRNVQISEYSPAANNNTKRIRQGKLPIYETKILTIDSTRKVSLAGGSSESQSERNSPRMHLRRGHIRRLPDRNIWVNSAVIGSPEAGVLDKQYRVRK